MNRLTKLEDLENHQWYKSYFVKMAKMEIIYLRHFCESNQNLTQEAFSKKVALAFDGVNPKPKHWKEITEILSVVNS